MNSFSLQRLLLSLCLLAGASIGHAADKQTRVFHVRIDDQPAGQFSITQETDAGGRETMTAVTHVTFTRFLLTYKYDLHTKEEWQQGKLMRLHTDVNDDGTRTAVRMNEPGLVYVNGKRNNIRESALTVTGWRLPADVEKASSYTALDAETGQTLPVQVTFLGTVQVSVANQTIGGRRYRMTGKDVDAELWFDASGRLIGSVRQEDGHRVTLTLTAIQS
jgi:hypothetical protein